MCVGEAVSDQDRTPFLSLVGPPEGVQHTPCQMESGLSAISVQVLTMAIHCQEWGKRDRLSCCRRRGEECEAVMLQAINDLCVVFVHQPLMCVQCVLLIPP